MSKDKKKKGSRSRLKKIYSPAKGFAKPSSNNRLNSQKIEVVLQQGIQCYQSGEYEKAQNIFHRVLEEQENNTEALYLFSATSSQLGQHDIAVKSLQLAINLQPNEPRYHFQLGNTFQSQDLFGQAIQSFETVVKIAPNFTDVYYNLGNAYLLNSSFNEAIAAYQRHLQIDPEHYDSFNNLGHAFLAIEAYQDAISAFEKTIELRPQDYSGYNHIGTVFQQQEQYEEALQYFGQALDIDPGNPNIKYNLGNALQEQGNISRAIKVYREVLGQQPDNIKAKFNLGWSLLLSGELLQGWEGYEYRFKASDSLPPLINRPFYSGSINKGTTLFVWSEQGLGDSLQFIRYAVFLQAQGLDITVGVNPLLIKLFENCLGEQLNIVDQNQVDLSQYNNHLPLLSLPNLLQSTEKTIPLDIPYIYPPAKVSKNNLSEKLQKFNIGIVWGSSLTNPKMYKSKSITLSSFLESQIYLENSENIAIFSLQVGADASQIQPFLGDWKNLYDLSSILKDFYDTASIIEQLDLIITVDTAVAHLAGAMGKPVWTMLPFVPDWRWQLERKDTPWYSTMTLFRQHQRGDWASVFVEVKEALALLLNLDIENITLSLPQNQLSFAEENALKEICAAGEDLLSQGKLDQAIATYEKAIKLQPENLEILHILGDLYQEIQDWEQAMQCFNQAIKLSPNNAGFYFNLGNAFLLQQNYVEAEVAYRQAISLEPNNTSFLNNLSYSLQQQAKYDEALQTVQKLLTISPDEADAYNHLGNIYQGQERYPQAIQAFQKALSFEPQNTGIQYNLGNALQLSGDLIGAIEGYREAIELDPHNVGFHKNLAIALQQLGQLDEALVTFKTALELQPNDPDLHSHFGMCLLLKGDFKQGWAENSWRLQTNAIIVPQTISKPLWSGKPKLKRNQTILLWSEQGYGDIIQFIRYATLLHQNKIKIVVATYSSLIKLLEECLDIPIKLLNQEISNLGRYKYHTSIMNLPQIFEVDETNILADIPYLKLQKRIPEVLRLSAPKSSLKLGLVWAGGKANLNLYKSKSTNLDSFFSGLEELFDSEIVTFYSLQVGDDTAQIQPFIEKYNNIFDLESLLTDFYNTACIIEQLDLVITVDTAVAHLAGAMGKKVWVMLPFVPDWRWQLVGEKTHWYPSMYLFRQPKLDDWHSVFQSIQAELFSLLNLDFKPSKFSSINTSQVIEIDPTLEAQSYYLNLGSQLQEQGKIDEAIATYKQALQAQPQNTELLNTLGNLYQEYEQVELAIEEFKKAVKIAPNEAGLQFNLGNALLTQKEYEAAVIAYQKAIEIEPHNIGIINNLGYALQKQEKYDRALVAFQRIIDLQPNEADAYNHVGNIYQELKDYPQAIKYFQWALDYKKNDAGYQYNLGNTYQLNKEYKKAAIAYQKVLEIDPNNAAAQYNLGSSFLDLRQLDNAILAYKKAIKLKPDYAEAHVNLSLVLLVTGKLQEGWQEYEWRFHTQQVIPPNLSSQMWEGFFTLENNELYLWSEQGLGDSIQFIRYANLLKNKGINIKLVTIKPLIRLFQEYLTEKIEILEEEAIDLSKVDNHASLMSLPYILKTQEETIPCSISYIKVNHENPTLVLPECKGLKIGIVWASGVANQGMYANKSLEIDLFFSIFKDLLNTDLVTLFSLQVGKDESQISPWTSYKNVYDMSPTIKDFHDTANIINQLDLVISVDTAVAHLAGAMGKKTWLLLPQIPDWRWQLNREDTPWYPTMRLFRQPHKNDWQSVVDNVKSNLLELINEDQPSQKHASVNSNYIDRNQPKKKMKKKTCLHIISYFEGSLGYNVHARELTNVLEKIVDSQDIEIVRTNVQDMSYEKTANQRARLLQDKDKEFNIFNICLSMGNDTWIHLERFPGIKIAYTVWESTKLPDDWIVPLKKCDYVWTASHWGKEILRQNGISLDKLYVVPEGIDVDIFNPQQNVNQQLLENNQFKFFTIGKCETRKSTTELIHAFDLEFWQEPEVVLVLSCDHPFIPTFDLSAFINNLWLNNYNQFLLVQRVDSHITLAQIAAACQCGVFPTKAEGWGLPILESMALGKPTIVTNYSAVTEYADESNAIFIDYDIAPIQDFDLKAFVRADENYGTWAQPKTSDLRKKMRYVYENYKVLKQKFIDSSAKVREEWSWEVSAKKMLKVVQEILDKEESQQAHLSPMEQFFQREVKEAENLKKLLGKHANSIITTTEQGIFAVAPEDMYVGKLLRDCGSYGENELVLLEKLFTKKSNVLIVGAHIGSLSIPIAKKCKHLVAIEANPRTFELLEINLKINNIKNCTALNIAASDKKEHIEFLLSRTNSGGSKRVPIKKELMYYYDQPDSIKVEAFPLDTYLSIQTFDLILMDIEGSEYFALKGMQKILSQAKALQIEFIPHHIENVAGISLEKFISLIQPHFSKLMIPSKQKIVNKCDFENDLMEMFKNGEADQGLIFTK